MTATYKKSGFDYMPAIKHADGHIETLWGSPLGSIAAAKKYAKLYINARG